MRIFVIIDRKQNFTKQRKNWKTRLNFQKKYLLIIDVQYAKMVLYSIRVSQLFRTVLYKSDFRNLSEDRCNATHKCK